MKRIPTRFGRLVRAVVVLTLALGLAGCGAVIDTTLTVNADGSGERVMVLTLDGDDADELDGDAGSVDASIRARLPESLEHSGVSQTDDGGLTVTFTLPFDSPSDYIDKATALLALSDSSSSPPMFTVSDSLLVSGVEIEERFSSHALLRWMFVGLVEDGLVSATLGEGNMYELGTTALEFAGEQRSQPYGQFSDSILDDHGFAEVTAQTDISDFEGIERTLTFRADDAVDDRRYLDYFSEHTPEGAELQRDADTWSMTFHGDATEVAADTDLALSTIGSTLDIDASPSPDDPAVMTVTVMSITDCASVCAADASPLTDVVVAPEGFTPARLELDSTGEVGQVQFVPAFDDVSQDLSIGLFGHVTATSRFTVSSSSLDIVGDGFERLLSPPDGLGTLAVSSGDESTVYTVTIDAPVDEFGARYAAWAPGSYFALTTLEGSTSLWSTTRYTFDGGLGGVIGLHPVSNAPSTTVSLPLGAWVSSGESTAAAGEPVVTFEARAVNLVGIVAAVGIIAVMVVSLIFAARRRAALREWLANWRGSTPYPLGLLAPTRTEARPSLTELSSPVVARQVGSLFDVPHSGSPRAASGRLLVLMASPVSTPRRPLVESTFASTAGADGSPLIRPAQKAPVK